jgi:hypothetical protein
VYTDFASDALAKAIGVRNDEKCGKKEWVDYQM